MFDKITKTACDYCTYYQESAVDVWDHITPEQYLTLLISIAVAGWFLMKSCGTK